jgi:hypothetical protein
MTPKPFNMPVIQSPLTYNQVRLATALGKIQPQHQTPEFCNGHIVAVLTVREEICGIGPTFNEQAAFEFDKLTKLDDWRKIADRY